MHSLVTLRRSASPAVVLMIGQCRHVWIHAKALLAQVLLERAFAQTLATGQAVKPWSWADTWPVARVSVPRLGAERDRARRSERAGARLRSRPGRAHAAGRRARHRGLFRAPRHSLRISWATWSLGDEISVTRRDGRDVRFRVTGTAVVRWDASGIDPSSDGRRLALVTCWPLDATWPGSLRYVVYADMVDETAASR